jgi:hypothetical protein
MLKGGKSARPSQESTVRLDFLLTTLMSDASFAIMLPKMHANALRTCLHLKPCTFYVGARTINPFSGQQRNPIRGKQALCCTRRRPICKQGTPKPPSLPAEKNSPDLVGVLVEVRLAHAPPRGAPHRHLGRILLLLLLQVLLLGELGLAMESGAVGHQGLDDLLPRQALPANRKIEIVR